MFFRRDVVFDDGMDGSVVVIEQIQLAVVVFGEIDDANGRVHDFAAAGRSYRRRWSLPQMRRVSQSPKT